MRNFCVVTLLLILTIGAKAECAAGGLVVTVNKSNPADSLSMAQLRKLVLGDVRTWPDNKPVSLVTRDSASSVFKCILTAVVRMTDSEYRRYLANAEFRGDEVMPIKTVDSGATAARVVANSPGAIGVVEASAADAIASAVKVVRINGKLPGEAGYPL
jgi:ABC-type phosphate transport system substrate-binding protein